MRGRHQGSRVTSSASHDAFPASLPVCLSRTCEMLVTLTYSRQKQGNSSRGLLVSHSVGMKARFVRKQWHQRRLLGIRHCKLRKQRASIAHSQAVARRITCVLGCSSTCLEPTRDRSSDSACLHSSSLDSRWLPHTRRLSRQASNSESVSASEGKRPVMSGLRLSLRDVDTTRRSKR